MGAHRFFSNRHEEILWYGKTKKYYFNLDNVRIPFDDKTKEVYKRDKRLNPASIDKGKNPTNVWQIERLIANSKERVGHPTQKPVEVIRRLVKGLSYPGSLVLDFFAGSGTTGRVCIEENRHSILVDNDKKILEYLNKHLEKMRQNGNAKQHEIIINPNLIEFLNKTLQKESSFSEKKAKTTELPHMIQRQQTLNTKTKKENLLRYCHPEVPTPKNQLQ